MMKKLKVLVAVAAMTVWGLSGVSAQNGWWLQGGLGFNSNKVKNGPELTNFDVNVGANYMLDKNWSVGLNVGYNLENSKDTYKRGLFEITPQAIYSVPLVGNLSWTPSVFFTFGFGTYTNKIPVDKDYDLTEIQFGINLLSVEYRCSRHIAIGATFDAGTLSFLSFDNDINKTTQIKVPLGSWNSSSINFSFHYYL